MRFKKPLVSICCITYNHENYIKDALESFLMQKTNFPIEILIHDDASTDKTADIIREYETNYPDIIKPIYQKENQLSKGVKRIEYTFNFSRAEGKYIALCEGDDYWTDPCKLQRQVDYMECHPNCSLCFHAAEFINVNKRKIGVVKPYNENCISSIEDIVGGGGGFMATNSMLFRKKIMDNPPNFYFNDSPVGDYPLAIYLAFKGEVYYFNEFMSVVRRGVKGSFTDRRRKDKNFCELINLKKIEMLNDFNVYSNYMYDDIIKKLFRKLEMYSLIDDMEYRKLKSKDYYDVYNELDPYIRYYITLGYYFPDLVKMMIKIKRKLLAWRIK